MEQRTSTTVVASISTTRSTTTTPTSDLVPTSTASKSVSTLETDMTSSMASSPKSEGSPEEGSLEEGADPVAGTAGKLKSGDTEKTKSDKSSAKTSNIISATIFAYFFALTLF